MYLRAEELKVVEHFEPLLIIGTAILTEKNTKTKFCYVGLHPEHRAGVMILKDSEGETKEIPLASWPIEGGVKRSP